MPDLGDLPWPQLMARALGARVYPTGGKVDLPRGATLLASTGLCPNQAYAWGPNAVGFQFHPEAAAARLEQWFIGHACEIATAGLSVAVLRADTARHAPCLEVQAHKSFTEWSFN